MNVASAPFDAIDIRYRALADVASELASRPPLSGLLHNLRELLEPLVHFEFLAVHILDEGGGADEETLAAVDRRHITAILDDCNWVAGGPGGAAVRLGMKRSTLQYRMQKLGIARVSLLRQ